MAQLTTTDWVQQMAALTVGASGGPAADDVRSATTAAALLVTLAQDWVAMRSDTVGGDELDALAADLASVRPSGASVPAAPVSAAERQARRQRFETAVGEAGFAVYVCRRVLHPAGTCLFDSFNRGDDLCGRVLTAIHHIGEV